jgi:SAM-dependent methyltransferase
MTTPESRSAMVDANRSNWDSRVPVHLESAFYDVAGFIERQQPRLDAVERGEVGDVSGKSLLHLQCHIGIDTISWALLGATATGIDFSAPALEAARDIARQMQVDVSFVQADALQLDLGRQFDVVVATHGVLCWVSDVGAWCRTAARHLRPGGFLYLLDGHPFANVFDADDPDLPGLRIAPNAHYLGREPAREEWPYTYASDRQIASPVKYEWTHSIGGIMNAVVDAGLRVEFVHEFPFDGWQRFKFMRYDGTWWRIDGDPIPLMMSIKATRPM